MLSVFSLNSNNRLHVHQKKSELLHYNGAVFLILLFCLNTDIGNTEYMVLKQGIIDQSKKLWNILTDITNTFLRDNSRTITGIWTTVFSRILTVGSSIMKVWNIFLLLTFNYFTASNRSLVVVIKVFPELGESV